MVLTLVVSYFCGGDSQSSRLASDHKKKVDPVAQALENILFTSGLYCMTQALKKGGVTDFVRTYVPADRLYIFSLSYEERQV